MKRKKLLDRNYFYQQGIKNVKGNNFNDAIKDFDRAIALKSDFIEAYENRSLANLGLGNIKQAIDDINQ